jgi:superfamily II DNA or RNA helicase
VNFDANRVDGGGARTVFMQMVGRGERLIFQIEFDIDNGGSWAMIRYPEVIAQ